MGRNRRREERMLAAADRLNPEVPPPAPRRWPLLIAVIGDGSFQLTVQELANMIRHGQETVIFLVNNRGYVSESIHDSPYNYFKNWDYAGPHRAWNASDGHGLGLTATTGGEPATRSPKHASTKAARC
jgi:pyruvate decarboxylase